MYHQIRINPSDQDAQRFLWCEDGNEKLLSTYVLNVMSFGACCSPSTAQWVKNFNAKRFSERFSRAVESIVHRHYVDDLVDSFEDDKEAINVAKQIFYIHSQAGFELRGFRSISVKVMTSLNKEAIVENVVSLNLDHTVEKVLGMTWDMKRDVFTFKLSFNRVDSDIVNLNRVPTKREMLKLIMSAFDPHGLIAPIIINAKILMQHVWKQGLDWDQRLSSDLYEKWKILLNDLRVVENVAIPRCYSTNLTTATQIELHTFVDASELAFAAVSYLRIKLENEIHVAFVAAKTKVAPKKQLTIPRLELQAAVLGCRLAETIILEHTLEINSKTYWSDSQTVLTWIKSDNLTFKPFVGNRISEIRDSTTISEWQWISGKQNVADEATKPQKYLDLSPNGRWFRGPAFLYSPEREWKISPPAEAQTSFNEEIRFLNIHNSPSDMYSIIDVSRFSKWSKLVRSTAYVLKFLQRPGINPRNCNSKPTLLTPELLQRRNRHYGKKFNLKVLPKRYACYYGKPITPSSKLKRLTPMMISGIIRLRGRIDAAPYVTDDFKHSIILE
jgi:hypothetical protein